jgi:hypothetical protein
VNFSHLFCEIFHSINSLNPIKYAKLAEGIIMSNTNGWWAVSVYALALAGSIFANAVWAAMPGASSPACCQQIELSGFVTHELSAF